MRVYSVVKRSKDSPTVIYDKPVEVGATYAIAGWERTPEEIRFGVFIPSHLTALGLQVMIERKTAPDFDERIGEHRTVQLLVDAAPLSRSNVATPEQVADAMESWLATIRLHAHNRSAAE